jgi:hypothetical protein
LEIILDSIKKRRWLGLINLRGFPFKTITRRVDCLQIILDIFQKRRWLGLVKLRGLFFKSIKKPGVC